MVEPAGLRWPRRSCPASSSRRLAVAPSSETSISDGPSGWRARVRCPRPSGGDRLEPGRCRVASRPMRIGPLQPGEPAQDMEDGKEAAGLVVPWLRPVACARDIRPNASDEAAERHRRARRHRRSGRKRPSAHAAAEQAALARIVEVHRLADVGRDCPSAPRHRGSSRMPMALGPTAKGLSAGDPRPRCRQWRQCAETLHHRPVVARMDASPTW